MDKEKKAFWFYFVVPFVAAMFLYYVVAAGVSKWFFRQPKPEPETLIKYTVSVLADFAEFDWLTFSLPVEFQAQILQEVPDFPSDVQISLYHRVLNVDGEGHRSFFYTVFPWYLLASFVLCAFFKNYKAVTMLPDAEAKREDIALRGVVRADPKTFCKAVKKATSDPAAAVETDGGALLFSGKMLREHMSVFGSSGSGKSQFLLAFLSSFFAHKSPDTRCIVVDRKGEFYAHFGTPKDALFNPDDERSVRWSLFNELKVPEDFKEITPEIKTISKMLYPHAGHKETFWQDDAAEAFCASLAYCLKNGMATNKELVKICNSGLSNLLRAFQTLPEEMTEKNVFSDAPDETVGSVLMHLKNGVSALAACPDGDFSVKKWVHSGNGSLYLSSAGKNDTAFLPILSILIELIGRELKDVADTGEGGVRWLFVIDELAAYPKMDKLHFLVNEARSKGVAVIIATQTIQKIFDVYGERNGKNLLGNTKTKVIFRTIEAHDAEYLSRTVGSTEKERTSRARNENASTVLGRIDGRAGETKTKQIVVESAFLSGELQTLETGNAVVIHPAAGNAVAKLKFEPFRGEKRGIEFAPIQEKTVSAREYAEMERKRKDEEAAERRAEDEKKLQILQEWEKKQEAADEQEAVKDNYLL